ncbi:uncharacterized protein MCAP_0864-like [Chironomus tepperi]|uniref:uncharacterized protein MCAP_0864-like n=1 Tax=Chironomus tepperi TaxID=113505 RepID=UPI00391FA4FD
MEPISLETIDECEDTLVEEAIDEEISENFVMGDEESETFIKTETFDDGVVEIKPVGHSQLAATSSYVVQKNPKVDNKKQKSVKARQVAAVKSVVERPKTAREKTKISVNSTEWKPHTPGQLPSYLRKQKEFFLKKSTTFELDEQSAANVGDTKTQKQGDMINPSTSGPSVDGDHSQEIEKIKTQNSAKLMSMRTEIIDLKLRNESLEKQLNEVTAGRDKSDNELKMSLDRIRSLENKVGSNLIEIRKRDEKIEKFEIDVANLIKLKQDMMGQIKSRIEENQKLEKRMEKLKNELREKSTSYETLMTEKSQLEVMLEEKHGDGDEELNIQSAEKIETLLHENEALKTELDGKINEVESLKQDKCNLIGEINHLKIEMNKLPVDSSAQALCFEIADLNEKINRMSKNEKELNQKILMLNSKLDDERNTNIRNNALLEYRAEYIKTLQDVDNGTKIRLVCNTKDLEEARKQIKEFEKFKAAHKEEKGNFKKLLKTLETENTKLKTKVEMYEKNKINYK